MKDNDNQKDPLKKLDTKFAVMNELLTNDKVKSNLMYSFLNDHLSYTGVEGVEPFMATFKSTSKNEEHLEEIQKTFKLASALVKGKPAPGFNYPDIKGEKVSLNDLKGKYVYIDVWATWCGPCKAELPHLEKLQEKYHDNPNIVFTSISIDEDKEAWEKMVTEKEMKGVQLFADGAWNSSLCEEYIINGIPRFILIDKEGNLVEKDADRPSSDGIKATFKELLEKPLTSMK